MMTYQLETFERCLTSRGYFDPRVKPYPIVNYFVLLESVVKNESWPTNDLHGQTQGHQAVASDDLNKFYRNNFLDSLS